MQSFHYTQINNTLTMQGSIIVIFDDFHFFISLKSKPAKVSWAVLKGGGQHGLGAEAWTPQWARHLS